MIRRLLSLAATAWLPLSASTLARIASQCAKAGLIVLPAWALTTADTPGLGPVASAMIVLALAGAGLRWAEQVTGHAAAFRLLAAMRIRIFEALAARGTAPKTAAGGRLMAVATRDINQVEVFFAHTLAPTITAAVATIAALIWVSLDPALSGAGTAIVLGCLALAWCLPAIRRTGREGAIRGEIAQQFSEDSRGRLEIASLSAAPARLAHLARLEDALDRDVAATGWAGGVRSALSYLWPWVGGFALWWTTGGLVQAAVLVAAGPVFQALEGFARSLPQALSSARRYFTELDQPVQIAEPAHPAELPDGPLSVEFEQVSLGYGSREAVAGLSARVPAGGRLGIVGPSGSGKSTLADALVRLIEPSSGAIRLGGVNIADLATTALRRDVGLIEQTATILPGSVLENLRLGNETLSEEDARWALQMAHTQEIRLDANAQQLSGGQQQRVGIARVLARRPRVLILDEATSHQDAIGQQELTDMLAGLRSVTVIVIAHRREALARVDQVLELAPR
ncbi:hypothetical protein CATYP_05355 [Corynebacterium atypicum]|uniref:ABC transporter ATP-binding protein n=1 Tax=Corynebacterium atypicum TaxID=191610 RepID=A0ABM5QMV1_9CORY|nr:ABC transporter ATP-binding protein [Corynebacterium atypicum]AIG64146.1 hypothetical protein CATYP_05355 [Corynebacterium atypicum]